MNILTFDVEDWYNCDFISGNFNWDKYEVRIYDGIDRILNELKSNNVKGTFFCLGWLAENHPDVLKKIDQAGHQIGCHSYQHELCHRFTPDQFYTDTKKAKDLIENVIKKPVECFRAPGFSITENNTWAFDILYDLGFKYDCSIFPAHHDYGGFPSYGVVEPAIIRTKYGSVIREFPITTHNMIGHNLVFSGGGFFRLFPYYLIRNWSKQTSYLMTYFHPRDFDPDQPVVKGLPLIRRFKSYVGLKHSFDKFKKYISDFDFINLEQANNQIDWDKQRIIEL